jgi:splicing factor 3B subunit 2
MQAGFAPPWLLNMQRFGPPPSYPALRVPGVNAPPPPGASWGFGAGQYGKPPVDDSNKPLFGGDIFGLAQARQNNSHIDTVDRTPWGGLLAQEDEDDEGDEDDDDNDEGGSVTESEDDGRGGGRDSPSGAQTGLPSDIGGMDSVNLDFNLRKRRGFETEESSHARQAFRVIEEQSTNVSGFMGSDKKYNIHNSQPSIPMLGSQDSRKRKVGDVDVSLDLDVLQSQGRVSKDEVAKQYEAQRQDPTKQWTVDQEDLSQMIAEESRKRMKKEQAKRDEQRGGRT